MKKHLFRFSLLVSALSSLLFLGCEKAPSSIQQDLSQDCNCETEAYHGSSAGTPVAGNLYGRDITYTKVDGLNVWEGDILLTDEQLQSLEA
jgi:hypothetical protein